jgi:hypothetical protein
MTITYPEILPFKLRVLRALSVALKEITPDNGYVFDLADFDPGDGAMAERVFRGRFLFGTNDPIPMASILEGVHPTDDLVDSPPDTTAGQYDWPILIQGWVDDDPVHPTDPAYLLAADFRKRLAQERLRKAPGSHQPDPFGLGRGRNSILKITVGHEKVRPADDISDKAYLWLPVIFRIAEDASDPYA